MHHQLSEIDKEFYRYCCLDSAVTFEINDVLEQRIKSTAQGQYKFNINMLLPLRYMEIKGIRYDSNNAAERCQVLSTKMFEIQAKFNAQTGYGFTWTDKKEIEDRAVFIFFTKNEARIRKPKEAAYERFKTVFNKKNPDLATIGEIEDLCEVSLNEGSGVDFQHFLYEELKLPVQWSEPNKQTGKKHPTTDYEALLNLSKYCKQNNLTSEFDIIQLAIELRALGTRTTNLGCSWDNDGRMRFAPNIVGSTTGRITCSLSPTGNGRAGQGIPKYKTIEEAPGGILGDRDLFIADEGFFMYECDLEGADSWTVAAYSAMLGDPMMLKHLQAGIRPAKVLTLKMRGVQINYHDMNALLEASKAVDKNSWDYFASKRVVHGGSYMEGVRTIGRNILKDSEGKMYLSESECNKLKDCLLIELYSGIKRYHQYIGRLLSQKPFLTTASGQIRQFFGRPDEILTKAVAHEPQANTTHALKLALAKQCNDPENWWRTANEKTLTFEQRWLERKDEMHIQPLLTIHDAILGQFKMRNAQWAVKKIAEYFNNPITIAGITLTIPFEGVYGTSWGCLKAGKIK